MLTGLSSATGGGGGGRSDGGSDDGDDSVPGTAVSNALGAAASLGSNFTRIRSTTRSTMAKATAVRVSTGKKFSQLLIITPAVAIDSNEHEDYRGPFNSSSLDSGCGGSSEGSLSDDTTVDERRIEAGASGDSARRGTASGDSGNNNNNNTARLLPLLGTRNGGTAQTTAATGWRWCGLICSAVKCFRAAAATTTGRQQQRQRSAAARQPLAGCATRYTTSDGTEQRQQYNALANSGGGSSSSRVRSTARGTTRFSSNCVYEYTIKSYHHPARDRRSQSGVMATNALPSSCAYRSTSISSDALSLSGVATTESTIDHINNNGLNSAQFDGTLGSSTLMPGTTGAIVVTAATVDATATSATTPSDCSATMTTGAHERNTIMYKL